LPTAFFGITWHWSGSLASCGGSEHCAYFFGIGESHRPSAGHMHKIGRQVFILDCKGASLEEQRLTLKAGLVPTDYSRPHANCLSLLRRPVLRICPLSESGHP
jgi:hypothetical protein